jgi:hypothetical protein
MRYKSDPAVRPTVVGDRERKRRGEPTENVLQLRGGVAAAAALPDDGGVEVRMVKTQGAFEALHRDAPCASHVAADRAHNQ